jgi:hypothetical protein
LEVDIQSNDYYLVCTPKINALGGANKIIYHFRLMFFMNVDQFLPLNDEYSVNDRGLPTLHHTLLYTACND